MVFASNATLTFRRNGITDRTLRRHVETLAEAGLLERRDSPNRKRFTRNNRTEGTALRFGFDLAPLFARLAEFARLATRASAEREEIDYQRSLLRAALNRFPDHPSAEAARKHLRRKTTAGALATAIAEFPSMGIDCPIDNPAANSVKTSELSATNGKNVRHHQNSNIELIDKEERNLSLTDLKHACPEAMQYAVDEVRTAEDVIRHARTLAPMIGISEATYQGAQERLGPLPTAVTIWAILQKHKHIQNLGAYFHALTIGRKSAGFDPFRLIEHMFKQQAVA
jgi:replication initiation protein RepC